MSASILSASILSPKSNLLGETEGDHCYNSKPSYYKRRNLLATSSSFRQKCFRRPRSSSYTSLDDENKTLSKITTATPSFFSRRKKSPQSISTTAGNDNTQDGDSVKNENYDDDDDDAYDDNNSDESTFFAKQNCYSRKNLSKPITTWKSSVLKAVGVKSR